MNVIHSYLAGMAAVGAVALIAVLAGCFALVLHGDWRKAAPAAALGAGCAVGLGLLLLGVMLRPA